MNITIPQEQWGAMVGAAVMQSVTAENRDVLIKEAIRHLLTPDSSNYGNKRSPLQVAFDEAVKREAEKIIMAEVEKDDSFLAEIRKVIVDAVTLATTGERRGKLVTKVADQIADGLRLDGR